MGDLTVHCGFPIAQLTNRVSSHIRDFSIRSDSGKTGSGYLPLETARCLDLIGSMCGREIS
jgi:hypothetical protein